MANAIRSQFTEQTPTRQWMPTFEYFTAAEIDAVAEKFPTLGDLLRTTRAVFTERFPDWDPDRLQFLWAHVYAIATIITHPQAAINVTWACRGDVQIVDDDSSASTFTSSSTSSPDPQSL